MSKYVFIKINDKKDYDLYWMETSKDESRYKSAKEKYGNTPTKYISELNRCGSDKLNRRAVCWYDLAAKNGDIEVANEIKSTFPSAFEEYNSVYDKEQERLQERERIIQRREAEKRAKEEAELNARNTNTGYYNYDINSKGYFALSDKLFASLANFGAIVKKSSVDTRENFNKFDTSLMNRDGRAYLCIKKYSVELNGISKDYIIGNMTNEGGGTFGWMFQNDSQRYSWKEYSQILKNDINNTFNININ